MRFLFSTGSLYSYSIERCFDFAAAAGFDGIELLVDQRWESRHADYLLHLIERHDLPIGAVHNPFFFVPGWPEDQPGRIKETVELAKVTGAQVVVHHLPMRTGIGYGTLTVGKRRIFLPTLGWDMDGKYRRWLEEEYAAFQEETAVTLCIENMPAKRLLGRRVSMAAWNTPEAWARFPALTLDTTHLGTWGLDPVEVYDRLRGKVRHVHLSNYNGQEHCRPEDGKLRLDRLVARLAETGYGGAITVELHPGALDAGEPDAHVIGLMRTSLEHCRSWAQAAAAP